MTTTPDALVFSTAVKLEIKFASLDGSHAFTTAPVTVDHEVTHEFLNDLLKRYVSDPQNYGITEISWCFEKEPLNDPVHNPSFHHS